MTDTGGEDTEAVVPEDVAIEPDASAPDANATGATTNATAGQAVDDPDTPQPGERAWAVVADGYGIPNFYHEAHRRPDWTEHPSLRIPGFPADAKALDLTLGDDYEASLAADADVWADFQPGLYWVPGTNILYLHRSMYESSGPMPESNLHASAVAGAVSDACPDCYYLAIRTNDAHSGGGLQIIAEELPWVDLAVQTTSIGTGQGLRAPAKTLYEQGRLFFGPAGNDYVTPAPTSGVIAEGGHQSEPPWIVSVSGVHGPCHGVDMRAAAPTEIVADFGLSLPRPTGTTERAFVLGTSFSAPTAAGIAGEALYRLRDEAPGVPSPGALWSGPPQGNAALADGGLSNEDLRQAMHGAAIHWSPTEFDRTPCAAAMDTYGAPAPPEPWLKMGHGYIDASTPDRILAGLRDGNPTTPPDAAAWYAAYEAYREEHFGPAPS